MVQAGDRVRIKNHSEKFNGELGTVDSRNGAYVYVYLDCQPDNKEYPLEVYDNEIEKVENQLAIDPEWVRRKTREEGEENCMAGHPSSLADILSNIEGKELQQQLKDNVCAFIQRDDVLVLEVNYEGFAADDDAPEYIKIKYLENTNWK